jgi:ABC-type multidrug transport system fused ATPase/permease subunit
MAARSSTPKNLPKIYGGTRKALVHRLLVYGAAQAAVAFALAWALRVGLAAAHSGRVNWTMVAVMIASAVAMFALRVLESADTERLGQDYVMRVRLRLFKRVVERPLDMTGQSRWGVTMTRMTSDLNALRNWVAVGVARAGVATVTLAGLLIALLFFSPLTGVVVAAMVAVCIGVTAALTPTLQGRVREARRRRGRLANNLGEKMLAVGTVRHLGRTREELSRVRSQSRRLRDALVHRARTAQVIRTLPESTLPLAIAAVVVLTALSGRGPTEAPVTILLLGLVTRSLAQLARAWNYRLAFAEAQRRIGQGLGAPRIEEDPEALRLDNAEPLAIKIDGVRLGVDLAPLSFEADPGDIVHVRGPTGSGKSMLMLSIARFFDPLSGEIRLDDHPLRSVSLDSLCGSVQLVAPELPLLRGTVAENIANGKKAAVNDWIEALASACGLLDDPTLPRGLDSRIEEGGRNLPRGLRTRIALARAAAMRPRLLLCDDRAFLLDENAHEALTRVLGMLRATVLFASDQETIRLEATRTWHLSPRRQASLSSTADRV